VIKTGVLLVVAVPVESPEVLLAGGAVTLAVSLAVGVVTLAVSLAVSLAVGRRVATGTSVLEEAAADVSVADGSATEEDSSVEDGAVDSDEDEVAVATEDVLFKKGPSVAIGAGEVLVLAGACIVTTGAVVVTGTETIAATVDATGMTVAVLTTADCGTGICGGEALQKSMKGWNSGST
jgi:hypothetical protein